MTTASPEPPAPGELYASREAAEGWQRAQPARAQFLGPLTETMLDLAGVAAGSRVLDVAAGTGDQTLLVARRVGPSGLVLATDLSASMLEVAADAARRAGLTNVETRVMDARELDLAPGSFDAAISRMGLMLVPGPLAALVGIRRVLKPGGKLAAIVFSTAEQNPDLARPLEIARRRAGVPPPGPDDPGMFALGVPGHFENLLRQAGFRDVAVRAVTAARRLASADEAVPSFETSSPLFRELLARLRDAEREQARAEITQELRQFEGPDGFVAHRELLVGVGTT